MSNFWSVFVIVLVMGNILAMVWLLLSTSRSNGIDEAETTGHKWDGIEELNNPLPRWWLGLFVITIIYSLIYLYFYPGLGSYAGSLGWSQQSEFSEAQAINRERQSAFLAEFSGYDVTELARNSRAMETGERLFATNCSTCHGADGGGAKGFPNLTDHDWLYGGKPEQIMTSINNGRAGVMPAFNMPGASASVMARYAKYLAGDKNVTAYVIEQGAQQFGLCAACHGPEGKGNQALGAPNLTDEIWLHGSRITDIEAVLANGKQGNMPSFSDILSHDEIRLLTAYVLSLSADKEN